MKTTQINRYDTALNLMPIERAVKERNRAIACNLGINESMMRHSL